MVGDEQIETLITATLDPHKQDSWQLSKDPLFVEKVRDIVRLYLNPPERAVVLCVDEKTQIQALNRTAPVLPMLPGGQALADKPSTLSTALHPDQFVHGSTSSSAGSRN